VLLQDGDRRANVWTERLVILCTCMVVLVCIALGTGTLDRRLIRDSLLLHPRHILNDLMHS
jgi:hypothetical protein